MLDRWQASVLATEWLTQQLNINSAHLGSPAPSLCAAPGLASVGDCGRMLGSRACVQVRVRVQVGVCVHVRPSHTCDAEVWEALI